MGRPVSSFGGIPKAAHLYREMQWLLHHGLSTSFVAGLFSISRENLAVILYRGRRRDRLTVTHLASRLLKKPEEVFDLGSDLTRKALGLRPFFDLTLMPLELPPVKVREAAGFWQEIEQTRAGLWQQVRFLSGIKRVREKLAKVGRPEHYLHIRNKARLYQLLSEHYLHCGRSLSAVRAAATAVRLYQAGYAMTQQAWDLELLTQTLLVLSMGLLQRRDYALAAVHLEAYRLATEKAGLRLGAEYFRQLGLIPLQDLRQRDDEAALEWFIKANREMEFRVDTGQQPDSHEIEQFAARQKNFLQSDWEAAQELEHVIRARFPSGDLQLPSAVNWAAACGFATDAPQVHQQARELLEHNISLSQGYLQLGTASRLLELTPDLPAKLRADWARLAVSANSFKDV